MFNKSRYLLRIPAFFMAFIFLSFYGVSGILQIDISGDKRTVFFVVSK
jgi:hypothetical protein